MLEPREQGEVPEPLPVPVRVSLTHRVAKFSLPGQYSETDFFDEAFDAAYDWAKLADGAR